MTQNYLYFKGATLFRKKWTICDNSLFIARFVVLQIGIPKDLMTYEDMMQCRYDIAVGVMREDFWKDVLRVRFSGDKVPVAGPMKVIIEELWRR